MSLSLVNLGPGKQAPEIVNAIVEIPTGSRIKYEIDHHTGLVHVDRVLFSPFHYPAEYGFIPGTLAEDGDPADILVLINGSTYPGVVIRARPIALLRMTDDKSHDAKILAVATSPLPGTFAVAVAAEGRTARPPRSARVGVGRERLRPQAGNHIGHPGGDGHGRMLDRCSGEAAVRPRLGVEAEIEAQGEGQSVGISPQWGAEADDHAVEIARGETGVVERVAQRLG